MFVLKALIKLAERVTLSKFGASEQSLAFCLGAMTECEFSRPTIQLCLDIVERLAHHKLETIICHDLGFTRVVIDRNWMIRH